MPSELKLIHSRINLTNNKREPLWKIKSLIEESTLYPTLCRETAKPIMTESINSPTTLTPLKVNSTLSRMNSIELVLKAICNRKSNKGLMKS